jgi:hypothetical protein
MQRPLSFVRRGAAAIVLALVCALCAAAPAAAIPAKPNFQLPVPCGQTWVLFSYAEHNPADRKIDMTRVGGTTTGTPVLASLGGTVHQLVNPGGIEINHGGGWFTVYLHMHYELLYDANGDGDGETNEMVTAAFDGREYNMGPQGQNAYNVTSRNCGSSGPGPDGDTIGYFDTRDATFHLSDRMSSGSSQYAFGFGPIHSGITPVIGDWNGDGKDTIGYHDARDATMHLSNRLASGGSDLAFFFGPTGTPIEPVTGNWNG